MKYVNSAFLKILNKIAKFDKTLGIHLNGVDNNYPDFVESVIAESVTASRCACLMADYISGKGFGDEPNKIIVHPDKETTLLKFTQDIAESFSEHKGVYIHCNYNGNYDIKDLDVLPFPDCRIGKKDDNKYAGKILVCDDWSDKKKTKKPKIVDVYNPDKTVIEKQVTTAKGIEKYNGQILYFKFGKYTYPLSPIHPCLNDGESESQVGIYKKTSLKKGFFGKQLVITKPLVDVEPEDDDYNDQIKGRESFRKTIKEFVGVENSDGVLHLELEFNSDKLEDEILFKQIDTNINDKLFAHTETSVSDNIRMCFNNVPGALIRSQDGKMFGSSGEAIQAMKVFYQDQTNKERMIVNEIVNKLMSRFYKKQEGLKIVPLIDIQKEKKQSTNETPEQAKAKAQATLKGSVGGVTALLQIQQSVSSGTTDLDAAITIIEEIYGIDRSLAAEMLGSPETNPNPTA